MRSTHVVFDIISQLTREFDSLTKENDRLRRLLCVKGSNLRAPDLKAADLEVDDISDRNHVTIPLNGPRSLIR